MLDRITGMQVFARVAALGSLSAASRALGMSQTMATKHIAALEQRLGVKLLHRTTRRLTLTEAGRRYLEAAERILAELHEADTSVADQRVKPQGTLRVNVPVSFGLREIAPLLPDFAKLYPDVTVELGLSDRIVDLLEENWDLAVRISAMKNSSLIARKLAPCGSAVCAAPSYLAERGSPRRVADLRNHNCMGYTLSRLVGPERWGFGRDGSVQVAVRGNLRANNGDALVAAAVAGQGIVYEPNFLVRDEIEAGRLVPLQLDHATLELPGVFAVYPSERRPPAKVRVFIDFLVQRFGPVPRWEKSVEAPA